MDSLMSSAASGLRSRMEALELLANNLANVSTAGYKSDRESYGLYAAPESDGFTTLPVIESRWTDFGQGALTPTGNPYDLALGGPGFFAVNGPNGPLYTRNGSFKVTGGVLTTAEGYTIRDANNNGRPIALDGTRPFEVSADGTVRQDGLIAGRIEVVSFASPQALGKVGHNYFSSTEAPVAVAAPDVRQGRLEASNSGGAESAVRMVGILRQFEMLQKAIALGSEMNRRAVDEVARVNS
jgi:flagellar basal-body rod protein FlgF